MQIVARTKSHRRTVIMTRQGHEALDKFLFMSTDLWNGGLQEKQDAYRLAGKSPTAFDQMKSLTRIRADDPDWRAFSVKAARSILVRLGRSYEGFMSGTAGMPRFKSKRRGVRSFEVEKGGFRIYPCGGRRQMHKLCVKGFKPFKFAGPLPKGEIVMARIVKKASRVELILVAKDELRVERSVSPMVGGDLGIANQLTMSNGLMFRKQERDRDEIKRHQRSVASKKKGSKSRRKAVDRLRRACEREANRLHNKAHRISDYIIRVCGPNIAMEKLQIRNMVKNRRLARSISDTLWGKILRMLEYKCRWRGGQLVLVDPKNTSKTCNACSAVKDRLLLSERIFECESCGFRFHRDLNAACNVGDRGLEALGAEGEALRGAGGTLPAGFADADNSGVKAFIDFESMEAIDLQGSRKDVREALLGHHCI